MELRGNEATGGWYFSVEVLASLIAECVCLCVFYFFFAGKRYPPFSLMLKFYEFCTMPLFLIIAYFFAIYSKIGTDAFAHPLIKTIAD